MVVLSYELMPSLFGGLGLGLRSGLLGRSFSRGFGFRGGGLLGGGGLGGGFGGGRRFGLGLGSSLGLGGRGGFRRGRGRDGQVAGAGVQHRLRRQVDRAVPLVFIAPA